MTVHWFPQPEEEDRLLLTREDVAIELRVSPDTVDRLVKAGTLRSIKLGRLVRFRRRHLEEDLDALHRRSDVRS